MFYNSDISFYGGENWGTPSWQGWGQWQNWNSRGAAQTQEPAAVQSNDVANAGQAVYNPNSVMADPYALNPATFEGFLQKNVSELAGYSDLSGVLTPEMRQAYQDWMGTTEAGTAYGSSRYLGQLSSEGTLQSIVGSAKNQLGMEKRFEEWMKTVGAPGAVRAQNLWEQGLRLDTMRDPESHNVSKHRREAREQAAFMAQAGGFFSWS